VQSFLLQPLAAHGKDAPLSGPGLAWAVVFHCVETTPVSKPEWGTKQQCPKCGTRFYDLGKEDPVHCINCGHEWVPEPILKSKQPLPFDVEKPTAEREGAEGAEGLEDALLDGDDLDIDEAEDQSVGDVSLDDDDADLSEVVDPGMEDE
jgi:uncharacterized protein (TIGR02300 family)